MILKIFLIFAAIVIISNLFAEGVAYIYRKAAQYE